MKTLCVKCKAKYECKSENEKIADKRKLLFVKCLKRGWTKGFIARYVSKKLPYETDYVFGDKSAVWTCGKCGEINL